MSRPTWLRIIFVISLIATLGSLYLGFYGDPLLNLKLGNSLLDTSLALKICDLCRYTRIIIYPMTIISGVALIRGDTKARMTILPLASIGILLSGYQNLLVYGNTTIQGFCDPANPCSQGFLEWFGFITIPLLALIALIVIFAMTIRGRQSTSNTYSNDKN